MIKKYKALVLDDEPPLLELFTLFMAIFDWQGEVVTSEEAALALLRERTFDVLVVDYHMPKGNGLHFICRLRRDGITTPAIIMSGDQAALNKSVKVLLNIKALLKPFSAMQLKAALDDVVAVKK